MSQVLHIFRKDVHKHWLEIIVSLSLLLWFGWKTPILWDQEHHFGDLEVSRRLFFILGVSLCLSWWFLIARVIQDESLVGDRQFWLTRPYQRRWLLAAKALFVIAVINVPVLIFDVVLLGRSGFSPWHFLPGLLQAQFMLTAVLILPVVTISVITKSIAQFLLVLFALIVYVSGLTWVLDQIPSSDAGSEGPGLVALTVAGSACVALIVLQYFRRDTSVARWAFLGSGVLIAVGLIAAPYSLLIERTYPDAPVGSLISAGIHIERNDKTETAKTPVGGKTLNLYIPIDTSGLPQGALAVIDAVRLTIVGSGDYAWNSGWISTNHILWPAAVRLRQEFEVSSEFYSSVAANPVDMRIDLAVSEYREVTTSKLITITAGTFKVTDSLACTIEEASYSDVGVLQCKDALNEPAFAAHLDPMSTTCTGADSAWPSMQRQRSYGNPVTQFGGGVGLLPIQPFGISFGDASSPDGKKSASILCPGTKFRVATPEPFRRYRIETKIQAVHLANYRPADL